MPALFGPAGRCEQSKMDKIRSTEQYLGYLAEKGLNAFEYQCGHGVNVGEEKCRLFQQVGQANGIAISLHAPYYISLASMEEEKRKKSVEYIQKSAMLVSLMGGDRIVVHPGGIGKYTREEAAKIAKNTLKKALEALDASHLGHVHICVETMGKVNQLGSFEEVLSMCSLDERLLPCIDFGHMNARTHGKMNSAAEFGWLLEQVEKQLGKERKKKLHMHFSKIEYSAGGEVRHLTFEDKQYGPEFVPLLDLVAAQGLEPVIICESAGTQTMDALMMKEYYEEIRKG